jgi:hypothetical protein
MKKQKVKTLYYAHPMEMYGTTQEAADISLIMEMFPEYHIYNPNNHEARMGAELHGMRFFTDIVKACDLVVFRSIEEPLPKRIHQDIGAGVGKEILTAEASGIPVLEISRIAGIERRILSITDTRKHLRQVGFTK